MLAQLQPVKTESVKTVCIAQLEGLILSGQVKVGQKLPPERDLARQFEVSRPVVHEALVDLAAKGLVKIVPRVGTVVSDYTREGSLALLTSLVNYREGHLDPGLLEGLLSMRLLFETENARQAAKNRRKEHLEEFHRLIFEESEAAVQDVSALMDLDFEFHLLVARATNQLLYPLMLNSFKPVYTNFSRLFFSDPGVIGPVFDWHKRLVSAIADADENRAAEIMQDLLIHGQTWVQNNPSR